MKSITAEAVDIDAFVSAPGPLIDVRSPGEYFHGRMPGARNLPLFSDSERAEVGTTYKQKGHDAAVLQGLEIVGPKLAPLAKMARDNAIDGKIKVYCSRGGMRSASMAWLMQTAGLQPIVLKGGYKAFRQWTLAALQAPYRLRVLGGLTGSGKTHILQSLRRRGAQVLDLEALACHRGSSYGAIGASGQPTNEQFENELAWQGSRFDLDKPVWIEDESRMIGSCKIPDALIAGMRQAPLYVVDKSLEERLQRLSEDYAQNSVEELLASTQRLHKKLGGARVAQISALINAGERKQAMRIVLEYYDNGYRHALEKRQQLVYHLADSDWTDEQWAEKLFP